MSLVTFTKATKTFGEFDILDAASFSITPGMKAGLTGENGSGKSTILKLITGEITPDNGTIARQGGITIAHVRQLPDYTAEHNALSEVLMVFPELYRIRERMAGLERLANDEASSIQYADAVAGYSALGGYERENEALAALDALGIGVAQRELPLSRLSGGERARVALARALISKPDLLLLDEPDNHLDIAGITWLEQALLTYRGTLVIVSHDRMLLNNIIDTVIEVEDGRVTLEHGNLAGYLQRKRERIERTKIEYQQQQRRVAKLKRDIRRYEDEGRRFDNISTNDYWRQIGKKVAKTAVVRKRKLEKELADENRIEKPQERGRIKLAVDCGEAHARYVLQAHAIAKGFGVRELFNGVGFDLGKHDRLAVTGPNGCGKTTLLRILLGLDTPDTGSVRLSRSAVVFYCDQHHAGLDPAKSAYDELIRHTGMSPNQVHYLLAKMGLKNREAHKPVGVLSGGERTRLLLALLMNARANLLVLDEPTNHLDLPSIEVLEESLLGFPGAILFASHDRRLVDNLATRRLELGQCPVVV